MTKTEQMARRVKAWSEVNSWSENVTGLELMAAYLKEAFSSLGADASFISPLPSEEVDQDGNTRRRSFGEILLYHKRPDAEIQVLLCGHYDTVFAPSHPFQKVQVRDDRMFGPGVADMKGGLAIMLFALEEFEKLSCSKKIGWEVILNPDEEIGSPMSTPMIQKKALCKNLGLVFEPSLPGGAFASSRKGSLNFTIVAEGKSAHAGRHFDEGVSAIVPLCLFVEQINSFHGASVNIGTIHGGEAANIVPARAACRVNIRMESEKKLKAVILEVERIVQQINESSKAYLRVHWKPARNPKRFDRKTMMLFEELGKIGAEQGEEIIWQETGGVCDGNTIAAEGVPTIDTLGAVGGGIHTDKEWIELGSLPKRMLMTVSLLQKIAEGDILL